MPKFTLLLFACFFLFLHSLSAQTTNVGVGTANPVEKLDVNGNINLTGTIKVNGQDGASGQVLMKNANGALSWGELGGYKNFKTFVFTSPSATQTFIVPAGVTKVAIEIWGGGGGGANGGGGGGGGYAYRVMEVSPGNPINIVVGGAGQGATGTGNASAGGITQVTYFTSGFGVTGGSGAFSGFPGAGGNLFSYSGELDILSSPGQTGRKNQLSYQQYSATEFVLHTRYGNGGTAPFQMSTGGEGGQSFVSNSTGFTLNEVFGAQGYGVGEGGGGGLSFGYPGAAGRVIIRW